MREQSAADTEISSAILAAARAGDPDAFTALVERYDRRLRVLAFHLLGDPHLTDDALQDVYMKAFRALPDFAGRSALSTWLTRITYTTCVDHLRRRGRLVPVPGLEPQPALPDEPDPTEASPRSVTSRTTQPWPSVTQEPIMRGIASAASSGTSRTRSSASGCGSATSSMGQAPRTAHVRPRGSSERRQGRGPRDRHSRGHAGVHGRPLRGRTRRAPLFHRGARRRGIVTQGERAAHARHLRRRPLFELRFAGLHRKRLSDDQRDRHVRPTAPRGAEHRHRRRGRRCQRTAHRASELGLEHHGGIDVRVLQGARGLTARLARRRRSRRSGRRDDLSWPTGLAHRPDRAHVEQPRW